MSATTRKVPVDELVLHPRCQGRAVLTQDAVEEYAEAYRAGAELPPPSVFLVDGKPVVVDGFHRTAAAVKAGKQWIRVAIVGHGTIDEAAWEAAAANKAHGVRRTNEDKRRAVRMAFESGIGLEQSNRVVAEHCGVSHPLVARIRAEVESSIVQVEENSASDPGRPRQVEKNSTSRVGRDGKRYPVAPPVAEIAPGDEDRGADVGPGDEDRGAEGGVLPGVRASYERRAASIAATRREVLKGLDDVALAQRVETHLRKAEAALRLSVPVECACGGHGCRRCAGRGWVRKGDAA